MHQGSFSCFEQKNQNHTQTQNISSHNRPHINKTCFNNTKYLCCYLLPHTTLQSSSSSRRKLVQRTVNLTTLLLIGLSHFSLSAAFLLLLHLFSFFCIFVDSGRHVLLHRPATPIQLYLLPWRFPSLLCGVCVCVYVFSLFSLLSFPKCGCVKVIIMRQFQVLVVVVWRQRH